MANRNDDEGLKDVTSQMANVQVNTEAIQRVRDGGWVTPTQFNYTDYNASTKEEREAAGEPKWAANAAKYEWSEEFGDVGPADEELERELFGSENQMKQGADFDKLASIEVIFESELKIQPVKKFEDAGLHPVMLDNIRLCGYVVPTPIQAYVLPSILKNTDVIGVAQTGSGKTAAFLIPVLSKLMGKFLKLAGPRPLLSRPWTRNDGVRGEPLVLVIAPTRELATQIFDEARRLCYRSMLRPCVIYGGAPSGDQMDELRKGCDVLIATPGRLMDFMQRAHLLTLSRVKYTIIDEADEMVSSDWNEEMNLILGGDSNDDDDHVYMMFSATFPKEARALARAHMSKEHVRIRVGRAGSSHMNIMQNVLEVEESKKRDCLFDLLLSMPPARTIVFVNNKKAADFLDDFLYNRGLPSTSIHSDRTQWEREDAIRSFKNAKAPLLVATGVSARGLDIKNVMHVINYDLPTSDHGGIDEYVHRIGRTARIGNVGMATSFYNERNEDIAEALTKTLIEQGQDVPEFLEGYRPADGEELDFDDDTDEEGEKEEDDVNDEESGEAAGDSWGAGATSSAGWG